MKNRSEKDRFKIITQMLGQKMIPIDLNNLRHIESVKHAQMDVRTHLSYPKVIPDLGTNWDMPKKWNLSFFKENYGEEKLKGERLNNGESQYMDFTLSEYLEYLETATGASTYYLNNIQFHTYTDLANDYQVPPYFKCWYSEIPIEKRKFNFSWIYIGGKGTRSPLHLDVWNTSAWNYLISGHKLWLFYDISQYPYLYDGKVDPFSYNSESFSDLVKTKPVYCLQSPGDTVFTPSNWWHTVLNLDTTFSLTENFINASNYGNVLKYFQDHNIHRAYDSMLAIADQHLGELSFDQQ